MKKMKLFSLLLLIVLMTGCVKYNIGMEVGKDKSVTITIIDAIQSDYSSYGDTEDEADTMAEKGFTKEEYNEEGWVGFKLTKKYKNINDISSKDAVKVELSDILDEDKDEIKVYFQKKESLLKTTYIANFTIDMGSGDSSYSSYASSMDLKYSVKLPVKSDKQNATSVSEDGKTLTWNLTYGKVNEINYEFSMTNKTVYVAAGAIVAIVIIAIIFVVASKKKKNPMPMNGGMPAPNMDANNTNNSVSMNNNFVGNEMPGMMQPDQQQNFVDVNNMPNLVDQAPANQPMDEAVEQPTMVADLPNLENQPPLVQPVEDSQVVSETANEESNSSSDAVMPEIEPTAEENKDTNI